MFLNIDVNRPFKEIDTRWVQIKLQNLIQSRSNQASCFQAGNLYVHGGYSRQSGILSDLYYVRLHDNPGHWVNLDQKGTIPGALRNHTICSYISYLILFGGQKNMLQNNDQIYSYDLRSRVWKLVKLGSMKNDKKCLPALDSHSSLMIGSKMYIFGGYDSKILTHTNNIIEVQLSQIQNNKASFQIISFDKNINCPIKRANSGVCNFKNQIYIFGGEGSDGILADLWVYDINQRKWKEIQDKKQEKSYWPQKRKGHSLVLHQTSGNLFMFGGIREVTKQQNDVSVFLRERKVWVLIHSNTNELYDPSPTIKHQIEDSPNILDKKRIKSKSKTGNGFRLELQSSTHYSNFKKPNSTNKSYTTAKTQIVADLLGDKRKSVVQQKRFKEFMFRKKKLLGEITKDSILLEFKKKSHSPTSEKLIYSIQSIGQQVDNAEKQRFEPPKVIFDPEKGSVIGKKPCARDGHTSIASGDQMIIFGGDRHMVCFNDCYIFKMDKAMQSIKHYL